MARTNKYASLNFNDIYEKKVINSTNSNPSKPRSHSSSSSSSPFSSPSSASSHTGPNKTVISNSRIHGHMLVLSRPTPKPISIPQKSDPSPREPAPTTRPATDTKSEKVSDQTGSEPDSISLRPQGRTGSGSPVVLSPLPSPGNPPSPLTSPLPKSDRFVPPHLRPGFAGRQERPGPEFVKGGQGRGRGQFGSPNRYVEDGRPKSGGGYERMRRNGGEADPVDVLSSPGSSGTRPSSSGGRLGFEE